jgi:hypothetical protein
VKTEAINSIAQDFTIILTIDWSNDVSWDLDRAFHRAKPITRHGFVPILNPTF